MKRITVVGVGALGSHVVQFLRNCTDVAHQEQETRVVDFDRVEQKNVSAQFHGKPHVGKLKVQALQQTMNFLWQKQIYTCSHKLAKDNVAIVLPIGDEGNNLVVDCLDNGDSRRLLQDHVRTYNIPCIHGALAADGAYGRVVWDKDFVVDDETNAGEATCEGGEHLPFIALVSALLAQAAQEWCKRGKHIGFSISPGGVIKI